MPNSKLRCRSCKEYRLRQEFDDHPNYCSENCLAAARVRQRVKPEPRTGAPKHPKRELTFTPELKAKVRERDENRCRWCGVRGMSLEVHHIILRSSGGPDIPWNLISLCNPHHNEAHSDVKRWQGLLLFTVSYTHSLVTQSPRILADEYDDKIPDGPYSDHPRGARWVA